MTCSLPSHENKICCYCGQHLEFINESSDLENYKCNSCNTEFSYVENRRALTVMFTDINNITYKIISNGFGLYITNIYTLKTKSGKEIKQTNVIKEFSFNEMPNITPQNINEKIKLILTFL